MLVPISPQGRPSDGRAAARASIYRTAILSSKSASSPVKIRNISSTGALIEGPAVPTVGTAVQLFRGDLTVRAHVAWTAGDRCGLKFSASVDVDQWRAASDNLHQQRVDEVVRLVKAGAVPLPTLARWGERDEECDSGPDLRRISGLLEILVELLASDPDLLRRHGPALQNLDIAIQMLATLDSAEDAPSPADRATKLEGLRRSADQALQRRV